GFSDGGFATIRTHPLAQAYSHRDYRPSASRTLFLCSCLSTVFLNENNKGEGSFAEDPGLHDTIAVGTKGVVQCAG
ncbi:hypothetical protein, partial [Pseudoalteromonas sp.]|uniref:hypothetical protein n=1 Tax=Pseudoalteromonas sp. TaxID=53249 RepID=UPI002634016F